MVGGGGGAVAEKAGFLDFQYSIFLCEIKLTLSHIQNICCALDNI